jgi:hypothetical protein
MEAIERGNRMKAVIEPKDGLYLIRIYGSDNLPCDIFELDDLEYGVTDSKNNGGALNESL